MTAKKRIAIIGSGISGLGCAYHLSQFSNIEITIFEKEQRLGGHSNTIDFSPVNSQLKPYGIDTGFLVFNRRTYPRLIKLFEELDVPIAESEMSFSVSMPTQKGKGHLEWAGTNLSTVFAQRTNIFNIDFWRMLKDILRFNKLAKNIVKSTDFDLFDADERQTVEGFLDEHHFNQNFRNWYLFPMIGAIWSCPVSEMMRFPIHTLIHFCANHGLLNIVDRPQWLTVKGGSREYVKRIMAVIHHHGGKVIHESVQSVVRNTEPSNAPIQIKCESGLFHEFDEVVFACHSDQALELLQNPTPEETELLSSIPYQKNVVYVHTDESLLPKNQRAWAAWNYASITVGDQGMDFSTHVCVHYLLNKLQPLPENLKDVPVIVSLNPHQLPESKLTHSKIEYSHPIFDAKAINAQKQLPMIQGIKNTWFCGAWTGYGFHEDGLRSGELVAEDIGETLFSPQLNGEKLIPAKSE
jgi:predicted NAD/FAD-binding protein